MCTCCCVVCLCKLTLPSQAEHSFRLQERTLRISLALPNNQIRQVLLDQTVPIEELQASISEQTGVRAKKVRINLPGFECFAVCICLWRLLCSRGCVCYPRAVCMCVVYLCEWGCVVRRMHAC